MKAVKIRVHGFEFEDVARCLIQLAKDDTVRIQVSASSNGGFGGLAYDPATIVLLGITSAQVLTAALQLLAAYITLKKGARAPTDQSTPTADASRIIIVYGPGARATFMPHDIEKMTTFADEHDAGEITEILLCSSDPSLR